MSDLIRPPVTVAVETAHHLVGLRFRWRQPVELKPNEYSGGVMAEGLLSPDDALSLARELIGAAKSALGQIIADVQRGECPTCNNFRMVDTVRPGHSAPWLVHCPDCSLPGERNTAIPTLPGLAEVERKMLT